MKDSGNTVAVKAGASSGNAVCIAVAITLLWYTFDDRLAEMLPAGASAIGGVPLTMAFVVALVVSMLFALAGMNWNKL